MKYARRYLATLVLALFVIAIIFLFKAEITGFVVADEKSDDSTLDEVSDSFSDNDKLHWNHMPLSYNYNQECAEHFYGRYPEEIAKALNYITEKTNGSARFVKTEGDADIFYNCDFSNAKKIGYGETTARANYNYEGNVYTDATIDIYAAKLCLGKGRPTTLIHETLHLFGLDHSDDVKDVMYDKEVNCLSEISQKDIDYLVGIYG